MKMIQGFRKRMEANIEKMQEIFAKDLQELKNKQTEMNNTQEWINSRIIEAEESTSTWEERLVEITATKQIIDKRMKKKNEDSLRDLWDNIKCTNICIIGVPEGEERERTWENIQRDNSRKLPYHGTGNSQPSPGSTKSARQDKAKEEHTETHSNQTDKN